MKPRDWLAALVKTWTRTTKPERHGKQQATPRPTRVRMRDR